MKKIKHQCKIIILSNNHKCVTFKTISIKVNNFNNLMIIVDRQYKKIVLRSNENHTKTI